MPLSFPGLVHKTAVATTSGTSHDFTNIPASATWIVVMFSGVSTNGTSNVMVQIGDAGGIETTGYLGACSNLTTGVGTTNFTTGFGVATSSDSGTVRHGSMILTLVDAATFTWVANGNVGFTAAQSCSSAGAKSLSAALDRVRITTVNGTDVFDAGLVNVAYGR